jgi:hypothetical protein
MSRRYTKRLLIELYRKVEGPKILKVLWERCDGSYASHRSRFIRLIR